jgi:hypothetical protein
MGFTTYRAAAEAAHWLCLRIEDDVVVININPNGPVDSDRWRVEPRFVGARAREVGEVVDHHGLVVACVKPGRVGAVGGIDSIFPRDPANLCDWCEGSGYVVDYGGRKPCGRCGGPGVKAHQC